MKPRVMSLVIFTCTVGLLTSPNQISLFDSLISILFVAIGAGAAGTLNMWYEADLDSLMTRTCLRPIPTGKINKDYALIYGIILSIVSIFGLYYFSNILSATLLFITIAFYVFVYTIWLKRKTPQNIVIGGASGAAPVLIGWTATGSSLEIGAWILFLLVFTWTPAHFWALAIENKSDYEEADFPMLSTQETYERTSIFIALYSCATVIVSIIAAPILQLGIIYLFVAIFFGSNLMFKSYNLFRRKIQPIKYFVFSNTYLAVIFIGIVADVLWTLKEI